MSIMEKLKNLFKSQREKDEEWIREGNEGNSISFGSGAKVRFNDIDEYMVSYSDTSKYGSFKGGGGHGSGSG